MGKDTHFIGQPLFSQLLKLINKAEIVKLSQTGGHDHYTKRLDGYTHFVALLFAVLNRYDSLRELVIGMLSEANKLQHLGVDYMIKRSTIADANNRRSSDFFAGIYSMLYQRYKQVLSDSRTNKAWEKHLYIMDSTTISLFSNILKGVGRNPKHGKKKGGIKAHSVIKATENVPQLVCYTSAATHDHFMLKELQLEEGSFIALDRAYINYAEFERLTHEGVYYVCKMKSNLVYETVSDKMIVNDKGQVTLREKEVIFSKKEVRHKSRIVEYWQLDAKGKLSHAVLLTNNFDLEADDIIEIYKRRWQIETLFKQLKQNFPLKYFYGDSVNAIQSQIWVTLIANLLITIIKQKVKRKWSFSNMVTMIRQTLMYYIDMYSYLEEPEKSWIEINEQRAKSPPEPSLFDHNFN